MIIINEFLPNPVGKDADGEWIELFNNDLKPINLGNWKIKDASGKTFIFKGQFLNKTISSGEYLILNYKTTKISLNNDAETLFLYDSGGNLVDKAEFSGSVPEGKSFGRSAGKFILTEKPTPASANIFEKLKPVSTASDFSSNNNLIANIGSPVNFSGIFMGFFICLALALLFIFISKKMELFSD
jgi:hypothetical protein